MSPILLDLSALWDYALQQENKRRNTMPLPANIRVGPAGWSYDDWKGVVYPRSQPRGFHQAAYLSQYFPVIEINTSFYRPLRPELSLVWAKKVESLPCFEFTAKLYRGFTHEQNLDKEEVRRFSDGLAALVDYGRLGCLLMQFPWAFKYNVENRRYLLRLQQAFRQYPLVAEMRHASWNSEEALKVFIEHEIGFCNIDQPQLKQCLPPTSHVTSAIGYVRLHGRNYHEWFNFEERDPNRGGLSAVQARYNYLYAKPQLEKWKDRIERIASQTRTTYVVTNNHFRGQAVATALQLTEMISREPVDVPSQLLDHYPELSPIAKNAPVQGSLFVMPARRTGGSAPSAKKGRRPNTAA